MTIYDLMMFFSDANSQEIHIFDCDSESNIFEGLYEDIPVEYDELTIGSIDNLEFLDFKRGENAYITFNVSLSEMED